MKLDASGLYYRELNAKLRELVSNGTQRIELHNVCGQRYIGTDLDKPVEIEIFGTPGNDLGAFMDGPRIIVHGNAQDGCGNTMNEGEIIVHGHAGDIIGMSARGGKIFVQEDVGYRAAIHMKEYEDKKPVLVIGGTAQDFVGEYMAGGILVLLGLNLKEGEHHRANFIGTGMHGGVIYLRGDYRRLPIRERGRYGSNWTKTTISFFRNLLASLRLTSATMPGRYWSTGLPSYSPVGSDLMADSMLIEQRSET